MAPKTLIIGATGFVGSALLKKLEEKQVPLRVLVRTPTKLGVVQCTTEVYKGDLDRKETLKAALDGIEIIYYLAHAMNDESDQFFTKEKQQALNLSEYLNKNHKVIYLGGITPSEKLSEHLSSRKVVAEVFNNSKAKFIEFRASIIIGAGSASYEIIRSLVSRLPFIVTTEWSKSLCQPIALLDVIKYLQLSHEIEFENKHEVFEIGGKTKLKYQDILVRYAEYKDLYRPVVEITKFPREMAAHLLGALVPEFAVVGKSLIGSIHHETIVHSNRAQDYFHHECFDLKSSFYLAKDKPFNELPFDEVKKLLQGNKKLPSYMLGQTIQIFIPTLGPVNLLELLSTKTQILQDLLPIRARATIEDGFSYKLPKVGEFYITYSKESKGIFLSIRPEYYFQSLGWVIVKRIIEMTSQ
jgi:uncharacterized protein YbjT (DUF2867 family)